MNESVDETVSVADAPARSRFEISVGEVLAGFTEYVDEGDVRTFPHTEMVEDFAGRGLATQLIREALDATRALGKAVVPQCPAVRTFIRRNKEYLDLVPNEVRAEFGLG